MIDSIIKVLNNHPQITFAILFGSAAKGKLRDDSDIDIAVAGDKIIDFELLSEIQIALCDALEREVDLLDIHTLDGLILQEVFDGRIILKKDVELYAELLRKLWYQQEDMMPNIRHIIKTQARRFAGEE